LPSLDTFATLSPIPGFWSGFLRPVLAGEAAGLATTCEVVVDHFSRNERRELLKLRDRPAEAPRDEFVSVLRDLLSSPEWVDDERLCMLLCRPLCDLVYRYITCERDERGRPRDPVANFHLGNGAHVLRSDVNFLANRSLRGIGESCTVMVNYVYSAAWYRRIGRTAHSLVPRRRSFSPGYPPR